MISTTFLKDSSTSISHNATSYVQGQFVKANSHNRKERLLGSSHLSVSLSVCSSVPPSSCVITAPIEGIPVKFDIADIYKNLM